MKKLLWILFLLTFSKNIFSQPIFQKTYGQTIYPEVANDIQKTFDGGYMIAGGAYRPQTFGSNDLYLLKIDNVGVIQYGKLWGRSGFREEISSMRQTSDSGFILLTKVQLAGGGLSSSSLVKTNSQGIIQWNKYFQNGTSTMTNANLEITSDGGFIMATSQYIPSAAEYKVNIQKMDSNGDTLWTRVYKAFGGTSVNTVKQTSDHGYIIAGIAAGGVQPGQRNFLLKVNSTGDIQWYKTYSLTGNYLFLNWCEITSDEGFVFTCTKNSAYQDSATVIVVKTDSLGNPAWAKEYENVDAIYASKIMETSTGDFLITGVWLDSTHTNHDVLGLKIDSAGNLLWSKRYGGPRYDYGTSLLDLPGIGHIIVGNYLAPNGSYQEIYLLQTDLNGNSGCNENNLAINTNNLTVPLDTIEITEYYAPYTMTTLTYGSGNALDQTTMCSTVGVDNLEIENAITLFPNPASDFVELSIPGNTKDLQVSMINNLGCEIYKRNLSAGEKIETAGIADGIYYLRVLSDGKVILKKLSIIR